MKEHNKQSVIEMLNKFDDLRADYMKKILNGVKNFSIYPNELFFEFNAENEFVLTIRFDEKLAKFFCIDGNLDVTSVVIGESINYPKDDNFQSKVELLNNLLHPKSVLDKELSDKTWVEILKISNSYEQRTKRSLLESC